MLGRPFAWAVAAEGRWGVDRLFSLLTTKLGVTLQLRGMNSIDAVKAPGALLAEVESGDCYPKPRKSGRPLP